MRDAERFKDKIEVSLDSRQIFFLFFGGAVAACLVFVLGVMVGRRLESREQVAKRPGTSAAIDPLAALDELGADEQAEDLAYPTELTRAEPVSPAPASAPASAPEPPEPAAEKPPEPKAEPPKPPEKPPEKPKTPGRFTLQISSFQDRAEADAFVAKLPPTGYKPYIVKSDVPGKGTFYRVRMGEFGSNEEALAAKTEFETTQHIIAYVTKL